MTGIETLRKIRPLDLDICIIITTAYASVEAMFFAVNDGGAQTYIKKAGKWADDLKITVKQGMNWINPIRFKKVESRAARQKKSIIKRCFLTGAPFCPWMIQENEKIVFVGMPFKINHQGENLNIYKQAIEPATRELGLSVWRADEEMENAVIMCKICRKIQEAKYSIVDISGWNVNVFFEFGLICGLGKCGIILKDQKSKIPSNLQGLEYIIYDDNYSDLKNKIIKALKKYYNFYY